MHKERLYIDMDGVLVDFESGIAWAKEQAPGEDHEWKNYPGIFSNMNPLPGALEAFSYLANHPKLDVYLLSTAPWGNDSAWTSKVQWVKQHLGEVAKKRLILCHHKHLLMGKWLVDDRTKNGAGEFKGKHIHFGTADFPDWPSVIAFITEEIQ